jgi:hypothetical protein
MHELYKKLYGQKFYEFGFFNPDHHFFKRNILVDSLDELIKNVTLCNKKGWDAYISSYGFDSDPLDKTWDDVVVDKIWFDFDTDFPEELPEVKESVYNFNDKLEKYYKCKNYIQFSGSKGYHLYMYLEDPVYVSQEVIKETMKWLLQKFKPDFVCESILRNPVRMQRLPYTKNTKSGKVCTPLETDIVPTSKLVPIINNRVRYVEQQLKLRELNQELRAANMEIKRKQHGGKYLDFKDIPAQYVFEDLYGYELVGKDNRAWCPIHGGSRKGTPPVKVDSKGVYCFHCGGLNAFGIALHYYGDKTKAARYLNEKFGNG